MPRPARGAGAGAATAVTAALRWVGVVPQQPPIRDAPASAYRRAYLAKYPPSMGYSNRRPAARLGSPALGWALTGRDVCRISSVTTVRVCCGPSVQLVPSATTGRRDRAIATSRGVSPPSVRPSGANVAWAMIGAPVSSAAAVTASASSSRYPKVSRMSTSTPPSASALTCSRIAATRWAGERRGRWRAVTAGDTDPATKTWRPALSCASRAIRTPARLISRTGPADPCSASRSALAPNVLVWMTSTPAAR